MFMYSGPVLALALARRGAVCHWRNMLGPSDVNKAKEENPERRVTIFLAAKSQHKVEV